MKKHKRIFTALICVNVLLICGIAAMIILNYSSDSKLTAGAPDNAPAFSAAKPTRSASPKTEKPLKTASPAATAKTTPKPQKKTVSTIKEFLTTAMKPVGSTMYVYGGGWNKEDTGAGEYAVTIGMPDEWKNFFNQQNSSYNSSDHRYRITKGLDCSGYIGWAIYNTLETENNQPGYVFYAQEYASKLEGMGYGKKTDKSKVTQYLPGDIMSSASDEHVWISLGQCDDGSVVLVHSSPPGVRICGTVTPNGNKNSEAVKIAEEFMREQFPEWYKKYPDCLKGSNYLNNYDRFRWSTDGSGVLADPEGYTELTPEEVLTDIFYG